MVALNQSKIEILCEQEVNLRLKPLRFGGCLTPWLKLACPDPYRNQYQNTGAITTKSIKHGIDLKVVLWAVRKLSEARR